jgi:cell division protein FtsB
MPTAVSGIVEGVNSLKMRGNIMKLGLGFILFIALVPAFTAGVAAQSASSAAQTADDLRAQLLEVQAKEAELQTRARQLDEDLKPENIERSLAGVGSTRPEELRELRRRQLTIERDSVRAQLKVVETSRERLEAVIRTAETQAYQQSAERTSPALNQMLEMNYAGSSRWLFGMVGGFIAILGIVFVMALIRRLTM